VPPRHRRLRLRGDLYRLSFPAARIRSRHADARALVAFFIASDGALVSIRRSDIVHVAITKPESRAVRGLAAGAAVDIGVTGSGGGPASAAGKAGAGGTRRTAAAGAKATGNPAPGETKDGTALFNPDRAYKPEWDSRQVPGLNIGNPNSPNDYKEGRTLAYPSAPVTQAAPGDLPRAKVETGRPKGAVEFQFSVVSYQFSRAYVRSDISPFPTEN
jgi:hypothetical protein